MKLFLSLLIIPLIFSCGSNNSKKNDSQATSSEKRIGKQLNISVLWDLSDRINPKIHKEIPTSAERDIAIIKYFSEFLKEDMEKKGAYMAKGKLKVFFSPNPSDQDINSLAAKLDVDLTGKDVKTKKDIFDRISNDFETNAKLITDITIKTSKWEGSDIYRFFKNDIADYCISKDTTYRNILVILTDGYMYHPQSKGRDGNKSEYILADLLKSLGLRDNPKFKETFKKNNCGIISTRNDLGNLDILVLEINSEESHKNDEDVIKYYLENWFTDMKVRHFEIYNSDLPENTRKRIHNFLSE